MTIAVDLGRKAKKKQKKNRIIDFNEADHELPVNILCQLAKLRFYVIHPRPGMNLA